MNHQSLISAVLLSPLMACQIQARDGLSYKNANGFGRLYYGSSLVFQGPVIQQIQEVVLVDNKSIVPVKVFSQVSSPVNVTSYTELILFDTGLKKVIGRFLIDFEVWDFDKKINTKSRKWLISNDWKLLYDEQEQSSIPVKFDLNGLFFPVQDEASESNRVTCRVSTPSLVNGFKQFELTIQNNSKRALVNFYIGTRTGQDSSGYQLKNLPDNAILGQPLDGDDYTGLETIDITFYKNENNQYALIINDESGGPLIGPGGSLNLKINLKNVPDLYFQNLNCIAEFESDDPNGSMVSTNTVITQETLGGKLVQSKTVKGRPKSNKIQPR